MKSIHGGFLLLLFLPVICFSESDPTLSWPQNIETHYPSTSTYPPLNHSPVADPPSQTRSRTSDKKVIAAVLSTAAITFVAVGLLFLFWSKFSSYRGYGSSSRRGSHISEIPPTLSADAISSAGSRSEFTRLGGKIKGFIVDEDGLDVIYWRNLKSNSNGESGSSRFDVGVNSVTRGQPPPEPLPPEKKMIPRIPPPPPSRRRGSGSSVSGGIIKALESGSSDFSGNGYSGDMMEAMFGNMAKNRKYPEDPNAQIFILDQQRSKTASAVLNSLGIPLVDLIGHLRKNERMLSKGTLEKLVSIAPTRSEESKIMAYNGDPARLADAELFCYRLLRAEPSAFACANAMLFKMRYESLIGSFKGSLRVLESACSELRSSDALLKLLEAILNAGIQLNGGSGGGDVRRFGLSKLLKLCDYRSSDGNTSLLHFVVHKVVRNEGRRCALARNSHSDTTVKAEKEREFLRMGLPVVGGISANFSNVRKAAGLDYRALRSCFVSLRGMVDEMVQVVTEYRSSGYNEVMQGIVDSAEAEMKAIKEERVRVMDCVKGTAQRYQAADASDGRPLQLFVEVKDFLGMVDQACVEIARSLQPGTAPPDALRTRVTFPRLLDHYLYESG